MTSQLYSIEYLATEIELVLPTFQSWTVRKMIECLAIEVSITVQQLTFFEPPCIIVVNVLVLGQSLLAHCVHIDFFTQCSERIDIRV